MNTQLIKFFNATIPSTTVSFYEVNSKAMSLGYFVMPDACTEDVLAFLENENINPNSTFYKSWNVVISKNRLELFVDQVLHYVTTYGTDFSLGNGYISNDGQVDVEVDYKSYKVISCITAKEMFDKCVAMLESGIALKKETSNVLVEFIQEFYDPENGYTINVDNIKNREAQVMICKALNILPEGVFNLFRYIMFVTTGNPMIINNRETYVSIMDSRHPFDFNTLSEAQLIKLSSIFRRFKNIFCAFKHNNSVNNKYVINKLNRLSATYHNPFTAGFWETALSVVHTKRELKDNINKLNNFKIVSLINTINENCNIEFNNTQKVYVVRNGKTFMTNTSFKYDMINYFELLRDILVKELSKRLSKKKQCVIYPGDLEIACPTSEKNFVGNMPFGSSFGLSENNVVGIYWRNEWGTRDFDLHFVDCYGQHIGWNSDYYNTVKKDKSVIYSGDMTNAEPEATELMYIANDCQNAIININRYNGNNGSKFRLFFANEAIDNLTQNYMVNPGSIKFSEDMESTSTQQNIGIIFDNVYYAVQFQTGNRIVTRNNDAAVSYMNSIGIKAKSHLKLKDILEQAGFVEVDEDMAGKDNVLDLRVLNKDTLINLFS